MLPLRPLCSVAQKDWAGQGTTFVRCPLEPRDDWEKVLFGGEWDREKGEGKMEGETGEGKGRGKAGIIGRVFVAERIATLGGQSLVWEIGCGLIGRSMRRGCVAEWAGDNLYLLRLAVPHRLFNGTGGFYLQVTSRLVASGPTHVL